MKTNIPERIAALREAMRQQKVDAYIIPSSDPHLSEYPADRWKSREWISGFTGSAGTIVVTADKDRFPVFPASGQPTGRFRYRTL